MNDPRRPPYLPTNLGRIPNVYTTMLAEGKVAYVHISQMTPFAQAEEDARVLREFFAQLKDVPALVIDIRGNGGGDDRFWMLNIVRPLATKPLTRTSGGTMRNSEFIRSFADANLEFSKDVEGLSGTGRALEHSEVPGALTPEQLKNLPPEALGPEFGPLWIEKQPFRRQVSILTTARYSSWLITTCTRPPKASPSSARGAVGQLWLESTPAAATMGSLRRW